MIDPSEIELIGKWEYIDGKLVADSVSQTINRLISGGLVRVGSSKDGWSTLYKDPDDGRFWELTYPESDLPGGGPPTLTWFSEQEAKEKYPSATD